MKRSRVSDWHFVVVVLLVVGIALLELLIAHRISGR